jgi:hypothetical protein
VAGIEYARDHARGHDRLATPKVRVRLVAVFDTAGASEMLAP